MGSESRLIHETMRFTEADLRLSWYYFLSTLLLVVIAFYSTYKIEAIGGKILSGVLAGLLSSRLFVIYHDFHHEAILRKSFMARILMSTIGLLMLAPAS